MIDGKEKQKGSNRTGENLLNILGSIGTVAGPLIFGPDFQGDLGAPFHKAASVIRTERLSSGLDDLMRKHPETSALLDDIKETQANGGLLGSLGIGRMPGPIEPAGLSVPVNTPPQVSQQLQQPQYAENIDYSSPEFIARAARLDPAIGAELMNRAASEKPNDAVSTTLAMLKLRDYESPEQRRQRDAQARVDTNTETGANEIAKREAIERNKPVDNAVQKAIRETDSMDITMGQFKEAYEKGGFANRGMSQLTKDFAKLKAIENSDLARGALGLKDPNLAGIAPLFYKMQADYAKSVSGAAISEQEFKRLAQVMPRVVDSPDKIFKVLDNFGEVNRYLKLSMAAANRANDIEGLGFDRDEVEDFRAAQTLLRKQGKLSDREKQLLKVALAGLNLGKLADYSTLD